MKKQYCPYCGERLEYGCDCERILAEEREMLIEELEEQQHQSGFYAFQDLMEMRDLER